jgi:hypothetical protein
MDKVLETSGSQRHIPSSKPFRIQFYFLHGMISLSVVLTDL